MAESSELAPNVVPPTYDDDVTRDDAHERDSVLQFFLDVNQDEEKDVRAEPDPDDGLGLTLQIGGVLVTGRLISRQAWYHLTAQKMQNPAGELTETMLSVFEAWETDRATWIANRESKNLAISAQRFIHLRDAWIYSGAQPINVDLWRGDLRELNGWTLGLLVRG